MKNSAPIVHDNIEDLSSNLGLIKAESFMTSKHRRPFIKSWFDKSRIIHDVHVGVN